MARALSHFVPVFWACILLSLVSYLRGGPSTLFPYILIIYINKGRLSSRKSIPSLNNAIRVGQMSPWEAVSVHPLLIIAPLVCIMRNIYKICKLENPSYDTICIQGCAMSSLSMALNGKGYANSNQPFNPRTLFSILSKKKLTNNEEVLNSWLQQHQGYLCICNSTLLLSPTYEHRI